MRWVSIKTVKCKIKQVGLRRDFKQLKLESSIYPLFLYQHESLT